MNEYNRIISIDELYGVYREDQGEELLIDLRPGQDYKKAYIENSLNVPFNRLQHSSFHFKKSKRAYVFCKTGSEAPMGAKIISENYPELEIYYVATGGFDEWIEKKYPVVSHENDVAIVLGELDHNDPDTSHIIKETRILSSPLKEEVERKLPKHTRLHHFTDQDRNCYILSNMNTKQSIVINPLMEIHHHIIDQLIRQGCHCGGIYFFKEMNFKSSPSPIIHAKDLSKLTDAPYYAVEEMRQPHFERWDLLVDVLVDVLGVYDSNGNVGLKVGGIIFALPKFSMQSHDSLILEIY